MREEAGRIGEMINGTWRLRMLGLQLDLTGRGPDIREA